MRYCPQCGKQSEDNVKFCSKCGYVLEQPNPVYSAPVQPNPIYNTPVQPVNTSEAKKPRKKVGMIVASAVAGVMVLGALGFAAFHFWPKGSNVADPQTPTAVVVKDTYMLTVDSSYGGTVKTETKAYEEGSKVNLVAEADEGYVFVKWVTSENVELNDENAADAVFLMPSEECTATAVFVTVLQSDAKEDDIYAYKVYNSLRIEYSNGDFADSVTDDLELMTECSEENLSATISWATSDDSVIRNDGSVCRPQAANVPVTLTATIKVGEVQTTKDFNVKVIAVSDFNYDEADNYNAFDIEEMNDDDNNPVNIKYSDDMEKVRSISGKFSEVVINSAEAAFQAIYNVRSLLGLSNPMSSLKWTATNYDDESLIYAFAQLYDEYVVYGTSITVGADRATGEANYLNSTIISEDVLARLNTSREYSWEQVRDDYADMNIVNIDEVVYALGAYEEQPVFAYYIKGEYEVAIVSAYDGTVISRYSTVCDWGDYTTTGSGKDENGDTQTFPVQFHQWDWWFYYLEDVKRGIYVKGDNASPITHEFNTEWNDPTAISAYVNMIKVYDWYKVHLNRNSIDNNGMDIIVNVHASWFDKDNAYWSGDTKQIYFLDNSSKVNGGKAPTTAAGLDIIAHETTHGVLDFVLAGMGINSFPYENYTGAINEGYADVFGWLVDHDDNTMGENWQTIRDIANPGRFGYDSNWDHTDSNPVHPYPTKLSEYLIIPRDDGSLNQSAMVHSNSSLVYHAAYLMEQYGIKGSDLEKVWYKSLLMGFDATSDFYSVRRNLVQAGKSLNFSDEKMCAVRKAFDTEEIHDEYGAMNISFVDVDGNILAADEIEGLSINAVGRQHCYPDNTYSIFEVCDNGVVNRRVYMGKYDVEITANGYLTFTGELEVFEDRTAILRVMLIRDGEVEPVQGIITSATTGIGVDGVDIRVVRGWNMHVGDTIATTVTGEDGSYSVALEPGFYTLILTKEDYTTGYLNVVATPDYNGRMQNGSISMIIGEVGNYRVVLSWGANPSDLDSHLEGKVNGSRIFHVYFSNKNGRKNGNIVANLDVDDTTSYGPETTTFEIDTETEYSFYVDWYSGSGTWASSGGRVEVYSGTTLLYVFTAPAVDNRSGDWLVFTIKNGIFKVEDRIK